KAADIALGRFDFDHFGAQVEQMLGAVRTGEHTGEIDDPDAFEWPRLLQRHDYRPSKRAAPGPLAASEASPILRSADFQMSLCNSPIASSVACTPCDTAWETMALVDACAM